MRSGLLSAPSSNLDSYFPMAMCARPVLDCPELPNQLGYSFCQKYKLFCMPDLRTWINTIYHCGIPPHPPTPKEATIDWVIKIIKMCTRVHECTSSWERRAWSVLSLENWCQTKARQGRWRGKMREQRKTQRRGGAGTKALAKAGLVFCSRHSRWGGGGGG